MEDSCAEVSQEGGMVSLPPQGWVAAGVDRACLSTYGSVRQGLALIGKELFFGVIELILSFLDGMRLYYRLWFMTRVTCMLLW